MTRSTQQFCARPGSSAMPFVQWSRGIAREKYKRLARRECNGGLVGTRANGKRDHLKRHLDRLAILSENAGAVARFLRLSSPLPIEGHLVFSRDVPMRLRLATHGRSGQTIPVVVGRT